jgi:hypothetical protein
MNKEIFETHTPIQAMTSRTADIIGHFLDLRTRKVIKKEGKLTTEEARRNAIALYYSIINSPTSTRLEKLRAQERVDVIMDVAASGGDGATGEELRDSLLSMRDEFGAAPPPDEAAESVDGESA